MLGEVCGKDRGIQEAGVKQLDDNVGYVMKKLESYIDFPALQDPASDHLVQVMDQIRKMVAKTPSR